MTTKLMMHLESKKRNIQIRIHTHTHKYIDFLLFFFCFLVKNFLFFLGVWRSTSLLLSLLMFDWRTVSSSVLWLLDRRSTSLSFSPVFVYIIVVYFFLSLCACLSHPAVVMYVSVLRVCVSYFEKEKKNPLSICIVNKDTRKNCVNKKKCSSFLALMDLREFLSSQWKMKEEKCFLYIYDIDLSFVVYPLVQDLRWEVIIPYGIASSEGH